MKITGKTVFLLVSVLMITGLAAGNTVTATQGGSSDSYDSFKPVAVTSTTGSPQVSKAVAVNLTCGTESNTGSGPVEIDCSSVDGKEDIDLSDTSDQRLPYEIEYFNLNNGGDAVAWVWNNWTRDGSTQLRVHYGSGTTNEEDTTGTWDNPGQDILLTYHLDESSGQTIDSSSNSQDSNGTTGTTYNVHGQFDGARGFDGANDYIIMPSFSTYTSYTIATWSYHETPSDGDNDVIVSQQADNGILLRGDGSGGITAYHRDSGGWNQLGTSSISGDTWVSSVMTWDGSTVELFVDDTSAGTYSATGIESGLNRGDTLGADDNGPKDYLDGRIDAVRFYSSSKSSDWVTAEYDMSPVGGQDFFSQEAADTGGGGGGVNDTEDPVIQFNPSTTNQGVQPLRQSYIYANYTATDNVSVSTVYSELDGTNQTASKTTGEPFYTYNHTGLADGSHDLRGWVNDTAGNTDSTGTRTLTLDTTPPSCSDNSTSTWISRSETVNISCSDTTDTVDQIEYWKDGAYNTVSDFYTLVHFNTDSNHDLAYTAQDPAGNNASTSTTNVKIDTTSPTISINANTTAGGANISQDWIFNSVNAADPLSGVSQVQEDFDNTNSSFSNAYDPIYEENHTGLNEDQTYTWYSWAEDQAGNTAFTAKRTATINTTAPTGVLPTLITLVSPDDKETFKDGDTVSFEFDVQAPNGTVFLFKNNSQIKTFSHTEGTTTYIHQIQGSVGFYNWYVEHRNSTIPAEEQLIIREDAEDGDLNGWTGDTQNLTNINDGQVINESRSIEQKADPNIFSSTDYGEGDFNDALNVTATVNIDDQTGGSADEVTIGWGDASFQLLNIDFGMNGNIILQDVRNVSGGPKEDQRIGTWSANTDYDIRANFFNQSIGSGRKKIHNFTLFINGNKEGQWHATASQTKMRQFQFIVDNDNHNSAVTAQVDDIRFLDWEPTRGGNVTGNSSIRTYTVDKKSIDFDVGFEFPNNRGNSVSFINRSSFTDSKASVPIFINYTTETSGTLKYYERASNESYNQFATSPVPASGFHRSNRTTASIENGTSTTLTIDGEEHTIEVVEIVNTESAKIKADGLSKTVSEREYFTVKQTGSSDSDDGNERRYIRVKEVNQGDPGTVAITVSDIRISQVRNYYDLRVAFEPDTGGTGKDSIRYPVGVGLPLLWIEQPNGVHTFSGGKKNYELYTKYVIRTTSEPFKSIDPRIKYPNGTVIRNADIRTEPGGVKWIDISDFSNNKTQFGYINVPTSGKYTWYFCGSVAGKEQVCSKRLNFTVNTLNLYNADDRDQLKEDSGTDKILVNDTEFLDTDGDGTGDATLHVNYTTSSPDPGEVVGKGNITDTVVRFVATVDTWWTNYTGSAPPDPSKIFNIERTGTTVFDTDRGNTSTFNFTVREDQLTEDWKEAEYNWYFELRSTGGSYFTENTTFEIKETYGFPKDTIDAVWTDIIWDRWMGVLSDQSGIPKSTWNLAIQIMFFIGLFTLISIIFGGFVAKTVTVTLGVGLSVFGYLNPLLAGTFIILLVLLVVKLLS